MIQRIQSTYLLITAILMAVTIYSPLLLLQGTDGVYTFRCLGFYQEPFTPIYWTWGVVSTAAFSALLSFVNIFVYRKRKIQIKISYLISFIIVLFYIAIAAYLFTGMSSLQVEFLNLSYGLILPAIAFVFNILATIQIKKDEKLVQSLNRIR